MIVETSPRSFSIAVGAVLVSGYCFTLMWRRRDAPTARPLLLLAGVLSGTLLLHFLHVHFAPTHDWLARTVGPAFVETFWTPFVFVCYSVVLGLLTVFVFEYTGRGRRLIRFVSAISGAVVLGELAVFLLFDLVPVISLAVADAIIVGSLMILMVLTAVGIFLVIDESTGPGPLRVREALVLSTAGAILAAGTWVFLSFGTPTMFTGPALLSSALLVFAVRRYSMFEALPAARVVGRDRVIDEMTEAVVVLGRDGRIQDINPAAARLLDLDATSSLGDAWSGVLPVDRSPEDIVATDHPIRVRVDERVATVTATAVSDERDRLLGYLLVCQDVTKRRERERRFAVLNRFLVGTVSERMEEVSQQAERLATLPDRGGDGGEAFDHSGKQERMETLGRDIWATTSDLGSLVTYARELEQGIATDDGQVSDVGDVTRSVADAVGTDPDQPSVSVTDSPVYANIEPSLLGSTLELLVTEATGTPPGDVELAVSSGSDRVDITISAGSEQDGLAGDRAGERAGSPVADTRVESGRDNPSSLGHLSGQLARLVVESVGGKLTVGDDVVVRVPALTGDVSTDHEPVVATGAQTTGTEKGDIEDEERPGTERGDVEGGGDYR